MKNKNIFLGILSTVLPLVSRAAQEIAREPLNIVLLSHYGLDNGAVAQDFEDAFTEYDPRFVILFNNFLLSQQRVMDIITGTALRPRDAYSSLWNYYFNNNNEFVMCAPIAETRSLTQLGFIASDWVGPASTRQVTEHQCACLGSNSFATRFKNLFSGNSLRPPLQIYLIGHGTRCDDISLACETGLLQFKGGSIAGMPIHEYQKFLGYLHCLGTRFLSLATCFGGSKNLLATVNGVQKPSFPVVVYSAGDIASYADSSLQVGRLFSGLTEMFNTTYCLNDPYRALTHVLKKPYNKTPRIENIPFVYVPGKAFFEPAPISNEVVIGANLQTDVEVPYRSRAILLQNPCFQGTILDKNNTASIPIVSRIPGDATHIIESVVNTQTYMRNLIQSFLPTYYYKLKNTTYNALKLWLLHDIRAYDCAFEQCVLSFDGASSRLLLLARCSTSYGMVAMSAQTMENMCNGPTSCFETSVKNIIKLSPSEYICLVNHLCQRSCIHRAIAQAMNVSHLTPSVLSNLFLQKQGFSNEEVNQASSLDAHNLINKNFVYKVMQHIYTIKSFEKAHQYHDLWRAYGQLSSMSIGAPDVMKTLPICLKNCIEENIEQPALYIACNLISPKQRENIKPYLEHKGSALSKRLLDMLNGTSDRHPSSEVAQTSCSVVDPLSLLHKIVMTEAEEVQFMQAIELLKKEKNYEKLCTLLSHLIPGSENAVIEEEEILFNNPMIQQGRSLIMEALKEDSEAHRAFVTIVTLWFNAPQTSQAGATDRSNAKLLLYYLFSTGELIPSLSHNLLLEIINGIQEKALVAEASYFNNLGIKYIGLGNKWLPIAGLIAQRLGKYSSADFIEQLPFSHKPLGDRLALHTSGTREEEDMLLKDFATLLQARPDDAIEILLCSIPYDCFIVPSQCPSVLVGRITAIAQLLLGCTDLKALTDNLLKHAASCAWKPNRVQSLLHVMSNHATRDQKDCIEKYL